MPEGRCVPTREAPCWRRELNMRGGAGNVRVTTLYSGEIKSLRKMGICSSAEQPHCAFLGYTCAKTSHEARRFRDEKPELAPMPKLVLTAKTCVIEFIVILAISLPNRTGVLMHPRSTEPRCPIVS